MICRCMIPYEEAEDTSVSSHLMWRDYFVCFQSAVWRVCVSGVLWWSWWLSVVCVYWVRLCWICLASISWKRSICFCLTNNINTQIICIWNVSVNERILRMSLVVYEAVFDTLYHFSKFPSNETQMTTAKKRKTEIPNGNICILYNLWWLTIRAGRCLYKVNQVSCLWLLSCRIWPTSVCVWQNQRDARLLYVLDIETGEYFCLPLSVCLWDVVLPMGSRVRSLFWITTGLSDRLNMMFLLYQPFVCVELHQR